MNTRISDAGLAELRGRNQLMRLDLRKTEITDAGVNDLRDSLPNTSIVP